MVVRNLTATDIAQSAQKFAQSLGSSQILFIPGGFSGGDEPDGSGKFITAFLRNPRIAEGIAALLSRDGLICGICNGFQALIKLGLLPFGEIRDMDETCPTLTFNEIGRHQSRLVRTRVASNLSPWLMHANVDDLHVAPVSHGEGRFVCSPALLTQLAGNGQIATQYVDDTGRPTLEIDFNPNGSVQAVEGITSPDGRIFGKMAHTERAGDGLYKMARWAANWSLCAGCGLFRVREKWCEKRRSTCSAFCNVNTITAAAVPMLPVESPPARIRRPRR